MRLQRIKETMKKIFCLPPLPSLLVAVPSYIVFILVFTWNVHNVFIRDISYVMESYAFVITAIWALKGLRRVWPGIAGRPFVKKILEHPLYRKYTKTTFFQVKLSLLQGSAVNLLYAGIKLFSGIYYRSVWLIVLALYYGLLAVMRVSLLAFAGKEGEAGQLQAIEWEKYRQCGVMLLFMNQVLTAIVVLVVVQDQCFAYTGALIYMMAVYAFYAFAASVRNMVKARKYASPVMAAYMIVRAAMQLKKIKETGRIAGEIGAEVKADDTDSIKSTEGYSR